MRSQTDWQDKTTLGPALRGLAGLRDLAVDFRGEGAEVGAAHKLAGGWRAGRLAGRPASLAGRPREQPVHAVERQT